MLETVRQYAAERLREAGEESALVARHAAAFLRFASAEGERCRESAEAMRHLTVETDNLRAAMDRGTAAQRLTK